MAASNALSHVSQPTRAGPRPWTHLRVLLTRASLDARIARERPTGAAELLRAEQLRRPAARRSLAHALRKVVAAAEDPPRGVSAAPPLNRRGIEANREWIFDLADALELRRTVDARGVAMTAALLRDGGGPFYDGTDAGAIHDAVVDALTELG